MRSRTALIIGLLGIVGVGSGLISHGGVQGEGTPGSVPADAQVLTEAFGLMRPGTPGGKLIVSGGDPQTFNPVVSSDSATSIFNYLMHRGLVDVNPTNSRVMPGLAKRWTLSDDGTRLTFALREGIRWSDGEPLTAEDIVFTYRDLIGNDDVNANARDACTVGGEFVEVVALSPWRVQATISQPFRTFLRHCMSRYILPEHRLADRVAKLNPGVDGDLTGIRAIASNHEDALRAADESAFAALEQALQALATAADARSVDGVEAAAQSMIDQLDLLLKAVESAELHDQLRQARDYAERAIRHAQAEQWEGVSPGTFNRTWTTSTPPGELVGFGPYVLADYQVDQQALFRRNPHYWRVDERGVRLPYLDEVSVLMVPSSETVFLYFQTGQTDVYGARPADWAQVLDLADVNGWTPIRAAPAFDSSWVALNQDISAFRPDDPTFEALQVVTRQRDFRQALSYAINRPAMIDSVFRGLGESRWSPIPERSPFHTPGAAHTYPYDPERAREMLDGLDLVDVDGDGTRNATDDFLVTHGACESSGGCRATFGVESDREIAFPLMTNPGNSVREAMAQQISHDWAQVGLDVPFEPQQFGALVQNVTGSRYGALLLGFTGDVDPASGMNVWRTGGNLHLWRYSSRQTPPDWEVRVEELLDEGSRIFDVETAVEAAYQEFEELVSEHLPLIYLPDGQFLYAVDSCLANTEHFGPQVGALTPWNVVSDRLWWKRTPECVEKLESRGRLDETDGAS